MPPIEAAAFNWLDWLLLLILAVSVFSGLFRGLIKQALDFASLFVGLFLADKWAPHVSLWLNSTFNLGSSLRAMLVPLFGNYDLEPIALAVLSFLVVWGGVSIAFGLLGGVLQSVARLPILAQANRLGGGALGALKGALIVFIVASLLSFLPAGSSVGAAARRSAVVSSVQVLSPSFYQHLQTLLQRIMQARL